MLFEQMFFQSIGLINRAASINGIYNEKEAICIKTLNQQLITITDKMSTPCRPY